MPSVFFKTLGCKVNTYDSCVLQQEFIKGGFKLAVNPVKAKIIIINSCCVTSNAEKEARYYIRYFRRKSPEAFIVITGCYAGLIDKNIDGPDLVLSNEDKNNLFSILSKRFLGNAIHNKDKGILFGESYQKRSRGLIKIQDGCNGRCSYCIIPKVRGKARSVSLKDIISEANRLSEKVQEVTLTGIHIGSYGVDFNNNIEADGSGLVILLKNLLEFTNGFKIHLSSIEPNEISEELLKLISVNSQRFCLHLHVPLQSGSDKILSLMKRPYNINLFKEKINLIRSFIPHTNIGSDIIAGFPAESLDDFNMSCEIATQLDYLHVFPFSKRPGTAAYDMDGQLEKTEILRRARVLRSISKEQKSKYIDTFIGRPLDVIWEDTVDNGFRKGHSSNYLEIFSQDAINKKPGTKSEVIIDNKFSYFNV